MVVIVVVCSVEDREELPKALEEMFFMVELHIEFSNVLSLSNFYCYKDQFRVYDFLKFCSSPTRDVSPKKRGLGTFLGHLSFWVSGMESPLIFLYTKK